MKKKLLFYMQVPFMDVNLEIIKMAKHHFDLHIIIELPHTQLNANIFSLNVNLNNYGTITSFRDVAEEWELEYLKDFFDGCATVNFAIYKPGNKVEFYNTTKKIIKYINKQHFDCFHFDDFSARQAFILPFIKARKRLILNIHDPVPHKGEFEWKRFIIRKLFYPFASIYLTFSDFSKNELAKHLPPGSNIRVFKLMPYTVFRKFQEAGPDISEDDRYISFLGRLSPYKGIELLLGAIKDIYDEFPEQKFFIAGRPAFGYAVDFNALGEASAAVTVIERHLSSQEMADIISRSKLVVCPYIEATQSGVVMTSYALYCPVLVTNTGGLPEAVSDGETGLITEDISSRAISKKIGQFLKDKQYSRLHNNLKNNVFIGDLAKNNLELIKTIYS